MRCIAPQILLTGLFLLLSCPANSATWAKGTVQVFILSGQSNMEGRAAASTLAAVIRNPKTRASFQHLRRDREWAVRDDVFVTYLDRQETPVSPLHGPLTVGFGSPKNARDDNNQRMRIPGIGPELGIGWVLGDAYEEPVLLIKAAWGGRAIKQTFRPPSAMPAQAEIEARLEQLRKKTPHLTFEEVRESYGSDYRKILSETQRVLADLERYIPNYSPSDGYKLAGFIWFQGWNDGVGAGNPDYSSQLAHFIRDLRRDLGAPQLPFVIGELGIDGDSATGWITKFRQQQVSVAQMPEFTNNVRFARTAHVWPNPPDLSEQWSVFRAAAKRNEAKSLDDPTRIEPGEYYNQNWRLRFKEELAYTSDKRYHYLGSGACYYQMGESMARAMLEMTQGPTSTSDRQFRED